MNNKALWKRLNEINTILATLEFKFPELTWAGRREKEDELFEEKRKILSKLNKHNK